MGATVAKEALSNITDHIPSLGAFHCAMIGLDSAGKTTVLYRLKFNQYMNTAPTIGFNHEKFRKNGVAYTVWDVGGQDKLRPLWRSYTRCADAIIFVVDSTKEDRMEEAKLELLKICKAAAKVPVLVLANKQDLPSALDEDQLESALGLSELGPIWHIQPTCAVTGEGLDEAMDILHTMILQKKKMGTKGQSMVGLAKPGQPKAGSSSKGRKVKRSHSHHVLTR